MLSVVLIEGQESAAWTLKWKPWEEVLHLFLWDHQARITHSTFGIGWDLTQGLQRLEKTSMSAWATAFLDVTKPSLLVCEWVQRLYGMFLYKPWDPVRHQWVSVQGATQEMKGKHPGDPVPYPAYGSTLYSISQDLWHCQPSTQPFLPNC